MVLQRPGPAGLLATVSYVLVLLLGRAFANTDDSLSLGCNDLYISDGFCDLQNDTEECGYDSGDCCECTCVSTSDYSCGETWGYSCLDPSAPCLDDDDFTTIESSGVLCTEVFIANGDCDPATNNEECGYDGGDCCECTCVSTEEYTCGDQEFGGFDCRDPKAVCSEDEDNVIDDGDDDDVTNSDDGDVLDGDNDSVLDDDDMGFDDDDNGFGGADENVIDGDDDLSASYSYDMSASVSYEYSLCFDTFIGDGDCDADNNNEECDGDCDASNNNAECGYDGGDCCGCDCTSNSISTCGFYNAFDCINPTSACVNGYIEAGTKTTITVSANAYDTRPGEASSDIGCGEDGCAPTLSQDGISDDTESRWSCAQKIVPDGELCEIEFVFEDPQDIMEIQVAFWKGDERSRTLEAAINGEVIGSFDSYPGSTFNALGIKGSAVSTLSLTSIGIDEDEWTSLLEVRFLIEP